MIKRKVKVLYHNKDYKFESYGDWIDFASSEDVKMKRYDFKIIKLGFSLQLPKYYELNIVPRSSTYKSWGVIQSNHFGVIDYEYCGNDDIVGFPAVCLKKETEILKNDRICQGKIQLSQRAPWYIKILDLFTTIKIVEVNYLNNKNRGGFGTTGK